MGLSGVGNINKNWEVSTMLDFKCCKDQKEEIKSVLFTELSKMYLHSMSYLHGSEATYNSDDLALVERGRTILHETIKVKEKKGGFSVDTSTTDDICFVLADEIENENSYTDGYHQNKESSIEFALQNVIDKFEGVTVEGEFKVQGNSYYMVYEILTRDGKVVAVDESGKENTAIEEGEKRYDEKRFLKDAEAAFPYKKFMETFKINNEFKLKDYKEFLLWNVLHEKTLICNEGKTYEEFEMCIYICVLKEDCVGIEESSYPELIKEFYDAMPNPDEYIV